MTTHSAYRFEIDWADDGYQHPADTIPEGHIVSYYLLMGGNLPVGGHGVGVGFTSGEITLMDPAGRYWHGGLSESQLANPHNWRLTIDGTLTTHGRAVPILTKPLGTQPEPRTWRLEGIDDRTLYSYGVIEGVSFNTGRIAEAIKAASGIGVDGETTLPVSGRVTARGTWASIINRLATLQGAIPVNRPLGGVQMVTPSTITSGPIAATLTTSNGIGRGDSLIGPMEGLVRTHYQSAALASLGPVQIWGADPTRWGTRIVDVPDWFTIYDLPRIVARLRRWTSPPERIQFTIADIGPEAVRKAAVACLPARTILLSAIPLAAGAADLRVAVASVVLSGGHGRIPLRRIVGVTAISDPGTVGDIPSADVTLGPLTLTLDDVLTVRLTWPAADGQVDIQRVKLEAGNNLNVLETVGTSVASPFTDRPGDGWWLYRSHKGGKYSPGVLTPLVGDPRSLSPGFQSALAPTPTATVTGTDVAVTWGTHLLSLDVYRQQLAQGERHTGGPAERVLTAGSGSVYHDAGLAAGVYRYRLRVPSGEAGDLSEWSNPVTIARVAGRYWAAAPASDNLGQVKTLADLGLVSGPPTVTGAQPAGVFDQFGFTLGTGKFIGRVMMGFNTGGIFLSRSGSDVVFYLIAPVTNAAAPWRADVSQFQALLRRVQVELRSGDGTLLATAPVGSQWQTSSGDDYFAYLTRLPRPGPNVRTLAACRQVRIVIP